MKNLTFSFLVFLFNINLYGQSVQHFELTPKNTKLTNQFFVGDLTTENTEEAKFKFLKWLTYSNVGEDIYIDEIEENRVVFTRIFPQGINMRVLKGVQYDILGNVDLAVRFVVEFKDSKYRLLIDRLSYFENELDSNSYIEATGKFKEYRLFYSEKELSRMYSYYQNPIELPLEYRNPEEIKKSELKKLEDLISLLNSFLEDSKEFEKDFYTEQMIVENSFQLNNEINVFPKQKIRTKIEPINYEEFISKVNNWFDTNKKDLGLLKLYFFEDRVFISGKRYFNASSGLGAFAEALTGVSFGDLQYYYLDLKINNDSFDFGVGKLLRARFTNECGTGIDKVLINGGGYEMIVDKKIYIPTLSNSATFGGLKEFEVCPAILIYDETTNHSDLFNKKGKPRKVQIKNSESQLAFYNSIYDSFKRNVLKDKVTELKEDW